MYYWYGNEELLKPYLSKEKAYWGSLFIAKQIDSLG